MPFKTRFSRTRDGPGGPGFPSGPCGVRKNIGMIEESLVIVASEKKLQSVVMSVKRLHTYQKQKTPTIT